MCQDFQKINVCVIILRKPESEDTWLYIYTMSLNSDIESRVTSV